MITCVVSLFFVAALPKAAGDPVIIYVDANADQAPHDGSDWCHAYPQLSEALAAALPLAIIRVADGTYLPDTSGLANPREASFTLASGVVIEGGYAGCGAADPDARSPELFETILSGDIGAPVVITDNAYHVVTAMAVGADSVFDGVTITDGNANGAGVQRQGGGIYLAGASPTIRGCMLRNNAAEFGAAIFNNSGHPVILDTTFESNTATGSGGGLYNFNTLADPQPVVTRCTFRDNSAASTGGAMRNFDSHPVVTACQFIENHARFGGAAVANGGQSGPTFARCVFDHNRTDTLFALVDCHGGAMHNTDSSNPLLVSCLLVGNAAHSTLPALSHGGAIAQSGNASSTLINCTLLDNYANIGHTLYGRDQSSAAIASSILWSDGDEIVNAGSAAVVASYSAVDGGWPGDGNTAADPMLAGHRLLAGSPCINTGDPAYLPLADTDLDGHARVLCSRVDMGAYEFGIGDYDCDQAVTLADFAAWDDCMTGPGLGPYDAGCESFDYEFDGDVDVADFEQFQRQLPGGG